MKNINVKKALLSVVLATALCACKKENAIQEELPVAGKYENGFFIINEGWFGHGTGSVSFFDNESGTLKDSLFQKENPDSKAFEPTSSTVQFATKFNNNLYVVSKVKGPVVVADAKTLKEVGRIAGSSDYDWRAFVGLDENRGLLSSSDGIYLINLQTLKPSFKLLGATGQTGDLLKAGKYIFALNQTAGAIIYNADDLSVVKKIKGVTLGFVQTPNQKVWYTKAKYLYSANSETLETDSVELPFIPQTTWFTWFSSPMVASTKENTVFIMKSPNYGGGKELYKYTAGNKSSLDKPFIVTPDKQSFYKKNLGFNPHTNQLVTSTVQDGYGQNYAVNNLYFHDPVTGALIKQIAYNGFYFPAMFVFQ